MLERIAAPLRGFGDWLARVVDAIYRVLGRPGKWFQDFVNGSWLGHPAHPVVTDVVIGGATVIALFDLARLLHGAREQVAQGTLGVGAFLIGVGELVVLAQVLGLLEGTGRRPVSLDPQVKARIESLVYLRQEARKQRDFREADRLREELSRLGVVLEDTRDGTTWKLRS